MVNAQGEDVRQVSRTPQPIAEMGTLPAFSDAWSSFKSITSRLELHYRDMQDVSSPFRMADCSCFRHALASAPVRRQSTSPSRWSMRADYEGRGCPARRTSPLDQLLHQ